MDNPYPPTNILFKVLVPQPCINQVNHMKTREDENQESGLHLVLPGESEIEEEFVGYFIGKPIQLDEAEASIVLNYGCLFFEVCS